jgi:hypothetical protein
MRGIGGDGEKIEKKYFDELSIRINFEKPL